MKHLILPLFLAAITLFASSCDPLELNESPQTKLELPQIPFSYQISGVSDHLPTLGRVLFYDPRLSINNTVSCGSCHKQALAFSDNAALSRGFENKLTSRNSMPIQNIISNLFKTSIDPKDSIGIGIDSLFVGGDVGGYLPGVVIPDQFFLKSTQLFWDGREQDLQVMVTRPITNHVEMGMPDMDKLTEKLLGIEEYQQLFNNAFGKRVVNKDDVALALSAFLLSIRSTNSKFDQASSLGNVNGGGSIALSAIEEQGRQLFFDKFQCNSCHELGGFADIGLNAVANDAGLSSITGTELDKGKFKIPSLRNVQLTGPYMHDGRFKTLEEVLEHYSSNIVNSPNLDEKLKEFNGTPKKMNMTTAEKQAIVAFLNTLTDHQMVNDPRFSNPFVRQ